MSHKESVVRIAAEGNTIRQALRSELLHGPITARELSSRLGVPEKDIANHLHHLGKTLKRDGARLVMQPSACIGCGFVFRKRDRLTRPGSCPVCGGHRIDPPLFCAVARERDNDSF